MRDHTDLRQIFGMEDILNKLNHLLNDFGSLRQEVRGFNKEVKRKYDSFDLHHPKDVAFLIQKFKAMYPNIILKLG